MLSCRGPAFADIKITALPDGNSTLSVDDLTVCVDSPNTSSPATKKCTLTAIRTLMLAGDGSNLTGLTKSQVGLSNVENTALSTWTGTSTLNILKFVDSSVTSLPADATKYLDGTGHYTTPSAAAAGGWTDDGTVVHNTALTDNIGIGTVTTTAKLTVTGAITASGIITGSSFSGNATTSTLAASANQLAANGANCSTGSAPLGVSASGVVEGCFSVVAPVDIDTSSELAALVTDETGTGALTFATSPKFTANVGIGSVTPGAALDVQGTVRATAFSGNGAALTNVAGWAKSGTYVYQGVITDNVGVGTVVPEGILDVGTGHSTLVSSTGVLRINGGLAPALSTFGDLIGDSNIWASGRGAPLFYDGTAPVALVGVLVSDVPTNNQVPVWNTNGTITWENQTAAGGSSITAADTQVIFSDGANNAVGNAGLAFNKATATLTTGVVSTTAVPRPSLGLFASSTDTDWIIGVNGDAGSDNDDPLTVGIGTTVPDMSVKMQFNQGGNIGIGTTVANQVLQVVGTVDMTGFKMNTAPAAGSILVANTVGLGTWMAATTLPASGGSGTVTSSTINQVARYNATGTAVVGSTILSEDGTNVGVGTTSAKALFEVGTAKFDVLTGGNVGVGTAVPSNKLYVAGTAEVQGFKMNSGAGGYVLVSGTTGIGTWMAPGAIGAGGGTGTVNTGVGGYFASYPTPGSSGTTVDDQTVLYTDGTNVGIGTVTAGYGLVINANGLKVTGTNTTNFTTNVGLGSTAPGAVLDVFSGTARLVGVGTTVPQQLCRTSDGRIGIYNGTWASSCTAP